MGRCCSGLCLQFSISESKALLLSLSHSTLCSEVIRVGVNYGGRTDALRVSEHMHTCASKYGLRLQCGGAKSAEY